MTSMFAWLRNWAISAASAGTRSAFKTLFALAMCFVGNIGPSFAADCEPNSLQFYMTMSGGCVVGNEEFSSFDYTGTAAVTQPVQATDINVVPVTFPAEGLTFAANWSVSGADLDLIITYDVTMLNNKVLVEEILGFTGANISCSCTFSPGDGLVEAEETTDEAYLYVYLDKEGRRNPDKEEFKGVTSDFVTTDVSVTAGPFSNAGVASVTNLFIWSAAPTPEPSTWTTMAIGFAGLGFVGYRAELAAKRRRGGGLA